jgi:hypothetical protein
MRSGCAIFSALRESRAPRSPYCQRDRHFFATKVGPDTGIAFAFVILARRANARPKRLFPFNEKFDMMFDYNPWTSLFLMQALHSNKPRHESPAKRSHSRQISQLHATVSDVVAQPKKLPPAHRTKAPKPARRGWRDAFRTTGEGRAEPLATVHEDAAA